MMPKGEATATTAFVVFSDDWGEHPSSCQHLFRHIVRQHPVIWVNTVGMRHPSLTWTDLAKAWKKLARMFTGGPRHLRPDTTVHAYQPIMLPFVGWRPIQRFNRWTVTRVLRRALRQHAVANPVVVTTVPNAADLINEFPFRRLVYYCVDDFAEWPGFNKSAVQRMEQDLIGKADIFVATSKKLFERLERFGKPTFLLPHGVDYTMFSADVPTEYPALKGIARPRVGYFGLIDQRIDQQLIADLARRMSDVSFVFAGPTVVDVARLAREPNVIFVGPVRYGDLPALAKGFDVLLIPYLCNRLAEAISPLKLKEYLATGKRVVSTPLPELRGLEQLVLFGSSVLELEAGIRQCFTLPDERRPAQVAEFLRGEDWSEKARRFTALCIGGSDTERSHEQTAMSGTSNTASAGRPMGAR